MYLNILKKDLKRKITMNLILLIFIILAATFVSSSVNNLLAISKAMETYFEKAGLSDFIIITLSEEENDASISKFLDENESVDNWVVDEDLYISDDNIKIYNGKQFSMSTSGIISSYHIQQQKFFDHNNEEITQVNDGELYMPIALMEKNGLAAGDKITVVSEEFKKDFTIAGNCKDAFLGSTMMGVARFIMSDHDYKQIKESTKLSVGTMFSVNTSDMDQLEKEYNKMGFNVIVSSNQSTISITYVMDMIIAGVLLVVSVCLILISLVILRFTIVFTLNEEYREIGIMKAIGLKSRKIRGLYIVKYLVISVIGSVIGFVLSIPFGNLFLAEVQKNIVIDRGYSGLLMNALLCILIILIVLTFCYSCTGQVNKCSPVAAIRSGSNGERFKRKGFLRLSKSNCSTVWFMALNDILSSPKKFGVLIITFTIGMILVIEPTNTINTLSSDNLVSWFGMVKSDVYLSSEKQQMEALMNGQEYVEEYLKEVEDKLRDNGIDATVYCETGFKFKISAGDNITIPYGMQGNGTTTDQYTYIKGQPPLYKNEVALTHITADKLGVTIGDTVMIKISDVEEEFIVTAIYQAMNSMGEGIRFSNQIKLDYQNAIGGFAIQAKYNDNPSHKEATNRFEEIKKLFPEFTVYTGGEYINNMIGDIAGQLKGVKTVILQVIILINMLVAVLMVKTFITKEKGEIGMLKSIGFRNSSIIQWQIIRIGIIMVVSIVLGVILSNPIGQISSGKVFQMMGASHIEFDVNPWEVYVIYPVFMLVMTLLASGITALQVRNITTWETNNME